MLCVGGRLSHSQQDDQYVNPVILPKSSPALRLFVKWRHNLLGHCGQNFLLADIRQRFWILKGNSISRSIIRNCVTCKSIDARPVEQEMADLPSDRVTPGDPAFTKAATDCFGPFYVKIGRSRVKRYGVIFTCLTSRAVHLEVAGTMETDSFINALRRFISRRGPVKYMRSDNGTNFVGADAALKSAIKNLNHTLIHESLAVKGIEWVYNPPYSSHWGGVWERQIRSVRRVMKGVCAQQVLTDEALSTLFCEVEAILNSRPLTRITDDYDAPRPLTPNMLLHMKGSPGPIMHTVPTDVYSRLRWKQVQYMADLFWTRWTKEYLPLLQERQRWTQRSRELQVGDVVMTLEEKSPRGTWPLAKVVEVIHDHSGKVRSARLKTETGVYIRPISKMCLLLEGECSDE